MATGSANARSLCAYACADAAALVSNTVIPTEAGTQIRVGIGVRRNNLGPRLRGDDGLVAV